MNHRRIPTNLWMASGEPEPPITQGLRITVFWRRPGPLPLGVPMFPVRFRFLNELAAELKAHGLQVGVDEDSICVGRPTWDRYANQFFTMVSAAPYIKHGQKAFFI